MTKIILYILVLVIVYLSVELAVFIYKYNNLPQLPATDQTSRALGSGPVLRYVAAGDSTSVGEGASNYTKSYAYQIAQYLAKSNTVEYKNAGVVGAKTIDVLHNQIDQIIAYNPDVVTISIGPNDATHLVKADDVLNNYKAIISKLKSQTTAKIFITDIANFNGANILPWFYINLIEYRDQKINKQLLALEDDRVKIIDIHNFGWQEAPYKDRSKTYAADWFHPNDLGYQNWTAAFLNKISNMYSQK